MKAPTVRREARSALARALWWIAVLCAPAVAADRPTVSGRLVDRAGEPVPGAEVTVICGDSAPLAVRTDDDGRFSTPLPGAGTCVLRAGLPDSEGRAELRRAFAPGERSEIELRLDTLVLRQRLEVLGSPVRDGVESREIQESFARDAGEALAQVEGMRKLRKGGLASDVVLRGFKGENLNLLVDGHRLYGACPNRMDPPAFHVDFAEIERIEVRKGPFDLAHGGGLGGAVNLVSREPEAGAHAEAKAAAGSFGYLAPSLSASYGGTRWSGAVGYSLRRSEPYADGDGVRFTELLPGTASAAYRSTASNPRAFHVETAWAGGALDLRPGRRLELRATRQQADRQLYPYLLMDAESDDAGRVAAAFHERRVAGAVEEVTAGLAYAAVDHDMSDRLRVSSVGTARGFGMATEASSRTLSADAQVVLRGGLTLGVEGLRRAWDATTRMAAMAYQAQRSIPDAESRQVGLFALFERRLSAAWRLAAGTRLDRATSSVAAVGPATDLYFAYHGTRDTRHTDTVPSANVSVHYSPVAAWTLSAGVGRSTRMPDAQERYFALRRKDSDWVGNPRLAPPKNLEVDFGARFRAGTFSFDLDAWSAWVTDAITLVEQPRVHRVSGVSNVRARSYVNDDARLWGGELSSHLALGERLVVSLGLSAVRGRQEVDAARGIRDPDPPEMSPLAGRAAVRYDTGRWFGQLEWSAAARQGRVNSDLGEQPTAGWAVVNLRGGLVLRRISILVGVDNLFDRTYAESLSYQRDPFRAGVVVREPGRSLSLSLRLRT